jgi:4-carboxymuconolactone decarboxylase
MSLQQLDPATRALLELAIAIALGEESRLEPACRACLVAGLPLIWVEELLLQSVLTVGWPRALVAFAVWRKTAGPIQEPGEDGSDYGRAPEWEARGEAVCSEVYGKNYERLRENVRALHPSLDAWMVTEGYGKTLGRPGLDLARRELGTVVQVAIQGAEKQLHSHLRGALNAGASPRAVSEALELVAPSLGVREKEIAGSLWKRVQE